MANVKQTYKKQISSTFNYRATWAPSRPIVLGQVGKLQDGNFIPYTTLTDLGMTIKESSKESTDTLDYSSEGGVSFDFKLAGNAVPPSASTLTKADAGIVVTFSKKNAVVFKIKGFSTSQITNLAEIEEKILNLKKNGKWKKGYVLISEVIEAKSASIIISKSKTASLEVKAAVNVGPKDLDIANTV